MRARLQLTNRRFGKWKVLKFTGMRLYQTSPTSLWKCRCDCGQHRIIVGTSLVQGKSTQCRKCFKHSLPKTLKRGTVFGSWTVLGVVEQKSGSSRSKVRCSCGTESEVYNSTLRNGTSTKCRPCNTRKIRAMYNLRDFSTLKRYDAKLVTRFTELVRRCKGSDLNLEERFQQWLQLKQLEKKLSLKLSA